MPQQLCLLVSVSVNALQGAVPIEPLHRDWVQDHFKVLRVSFQGDDGVKALTF